MELLKKIKKLIRPCFMFVRYWIFSKPYCSRMIYACPDKNYKFKIDYMFARHKYQNFGDKHNAGFRKWIETCGDKDVIFDVGAHIGLYSLPASKVLKKSGTVYSFEPSDANCEFLKKHMAYNHCNNISVQPLLVADKSLNAVDFFESKSVDPMNAIAILKNPEQYIKVTKSQISLDDFCHQKKLKPQVIKIDVEGAEVKVLCGAKNILTQNRPLIFLSVHPERIVLMKDSVSELKDLITKLGYQICDVDGNITNDLKFGEYIIQCKGQ